MPKTERFFSGNQDFSQMVQQPFNGFSSPFRDESFSDMDEMTPPAASKDTSENPTSANDSMTEIEEDSVDKLIEKIFRKDLPKDSPTNEQQNCVQIFFARCS